MRENKTSRSGFSARDDEHRDRDLRGARGGRDVPRSGAAEAPEGADRSSRGEGVIAGRAVYEGALSVQEGVRACDEATRRAEAAAVQANPCGM